METRRVLVFDGADWFKAGGDIGDNSCFWKPATILRERIVDNEVLIDVQFNDGRVSNGHFKNGIKPLE